MTEKIQLNNRRKDMTQHEIQAMQTEYNLADAHTRQFQSPTQREIVKRLPELWHESERLTQHELEERFTETFFRSQRQLAALKTPTMLVYASSIATVIIANYLALKKVKVSLLEPCLDSIHDILKNMSITLDKPLLEEWLHDSKKIYDNLSENVNADALFIIEPNNPTGFTFEPSNPTDLSLEGMTRFVDIRKSSLLELIRYAKDYDKLLIFDLCFSSFLLEDAKLTSFDVYEELEASGVRYIIIEDTGKTLPLQDTKVAMLKTSKDLYKEIFDVYTSYLLNVSPFVLNLVTQYIIDSEKDNFSSILTLVKQNRGIARNILEGSLLELQEPLANVSVAWLKIRNNVISATELQEKIEKQGVYVLPGTYFFWSDNSKGEGFIRIALARDTELFKAAIKKVRAVLDEIKN